MRPNAGALAAVLSNETRTLIVGRSAEERAAAARRILDDADLLQKLGPEDRKACVALAEFSIGTALPFFAAHGGDRDAARKAIGHYKRALEAYPDWPEAHLNIGVAYSKIEDWRNALTHYETSLRAFGAAGTNYRKHPKNAALIGRLWLLVAHARLRLDDESRAIRARQELQKGREILTLHRDDSECARWQQFSDQVEVDLNTLDAMTDTGM